MSDELLPQAGGEQTDEQASSDKEVSELKRARDETARYRRQYSELNAKWKEAEPVLAEFQKQQESQKTEAQKLTEAVTAAERKAAEKEAALEVAINESKLTRLAARAGVDLDLLDLIDISKLDLTDEEGTLKKLNKLAAARTTANSASNPARSGAAGPTEAELRDTYFGSGGRSKTTIFGG